MSDGFHARFARLLRLEGPQPVARLMAEAGAHYYATRDPFGTQGDFITAPEISQMFGELIGLWCADLWDRMGRPRPFRLIELGPGRGTLMRDALRAIGRALPVCRAAATVHLVETSPVLRQRQHEALAGTDVEWHDDLSALPPGAAVVIANEFLDALPIRQFERSAAGWHERLVAAGDDERLHFALSPPLADPAALLRRHRAAPAGTVVEWSPAREAVVEQLARHLVAEGGAALLVDYGSPHGGAGDTLQAMRGHRFASVLQDLGEADLTSHVDFEPLAAVARRAGARIAGPVGQGAFLETIGIAARADMLSRAAPDRAAAFAAQRARLTGADAMGRLFLVLGLASPAPPPLAGF
ncbi:class I SAM-dependent methyltransferase [Desertibaculum subflavum]|uniref:class I SAM-dependent methyltransferase n=1 Tax=Desertibaculum subflavum TaxID=2268458 RepID=UPI0034D34FC3